MTQRGPSWEPSLELNNNSNFNFHIEIFLDSKIQYECSIVNSNPTNVLHVGKHIQRKTFLIQPIYLLCEDWYHESRKFPQQYISQILLILFHTCFPGVIHCTSLQPKGLVQCESSFILLPWHGYSFISVVTYILCKWSKSSSTLSTYKVSDKFTVYFLLLGSHTAFLKTSFNCKYH